MKPNAFRIVLAGRSGALINEQRTSLAARKLPGMVLQTHLLPADQSDLSRLATDKPDVLILNLDSQFERDLDSLRKIPVADRPVVLTVSVRPDALLMRRAMQAGARDFLTEPLNYDEVVGSLLAIQREKTAAESHGPRLVAVINAKGGAGATLVATNLAHALAAHCHTRTLLVDLDLQFGSAALHLDVKPTHTVVDAIAAVADLDGVALEGYSSKHPSGLHVLGSPESDVVLPGELARNDVMRLVQLARSHYDHVVVDLPRHIDSITTGVLENADRTLIVVQQTLAHVRDAQRLIRILQRDLEIPDSRIGLIVNRYNKSNTISLQDIVKALGNITVYTVPNDYETVAGAANLGVPLLDHARKSEITKSLQKLAENTAGIAAEAAPTSPLRRILKALFSIVALP